MATATNIGRRLDDAPSRALDRRRAEDTRLVQRINAGAAELHGLWSAGWLEDAEQRVRRRAAVAALQTEIDRLYERRRQLVAERALLGEPRKAGRRDTGWVEPLAA